MRLHNTLTRQVDDFTPQDASRVTLYTCGPTVYGDLHVGNWVAYIRWDILVRTLLASGYTVERVMNVTDVGHLTGENAGDADSGEDKMQKGAARENLSVWEVAEKYTTAFLEGSDALNLLPPEHLTKATDFIEEQIQLVQKLEVDGHTYVISDGVYFDTSTFKQYADFAGLDLEGLRAGARVAFNDEKRHPSDFALWKLTPEGDNRAMEWNSPWGRGFPGWHLECSAMAMALLGSTVDIHTGGIDHIPVHHTNEIAQSEAASGQRFANYWLHANFLTVNGTKISKSLENGYTLQDIAQHGLTPEDFRMFVLQSHYRTESNFSWDNLYAAAQRIKHWRAVASLRWQANDTSGDDQTETLTHQIFDEARTKILNTLQDDLNTPEALKAVEEAFSSIEANGLASGHRDAFEEMLHYIDESLGLSLLTLTPDISDDVKQLIRERSTARDEKNWEQSDELRDKLLSVGVSVRDTAQGSRWCWLTDAN